MVAMYDYVNMINLISNKLSTRIFCGVDVDYNTYVYIDRLDGVTHHSIHFPLCGRGVTYEDACYDYVKKLLDPGINLRFKYGYTEGYVTRKVRDIIKEVYKIQLIENRNVF